jgi:hypothetical protein
VGATVEGFLRGWSAYHVQLIDVDPSATAALDLLGGR